MKKHITAEDLIKAQGTISCQKELKEKLMLTETLEEAAEIINYFESDIEMTSFITEMASTGKIPYKWSDFVCKINNLYKWQEQKSDKKYSDEDMLIAYDLGAEEAAEKFAKKFGSEIDSTRYYAFINGAKWQQERMYSEEEVYYILIHHTVELFKKEPITLEDFWNKFKKK